MTPRTLFPRVLLAASLLGTALLVAAPAAACSLAGVEAYRVDETSTDVVPPSAPAVELGTIKRGTGPMCPGGIGSSGSCDDLAWIYVSYTGATDETTPDHALGYRIRPATDDEDLSFLGEVADIEWLRGPVRSNTPPQLMLVWGETAQWEQPAIDATFHIFAVDEAGNESADYAVVRVVDPGQAPADCPEVSGEPDLGDDAGMVDAAVDAGVDATDGPGTDAPEARAASAAGCSVVSEHWPGIGAIVLALWLLARKRARRRGQADA